MLEWLLAILLIFIGGTLTAQITAYQNDLKTKLSPALGSHLEKIRDFEKIQIQIFLSDTASFSLAEKTLLMPRSIEFSDDEVFVIEAQLPKARILDLVNDPLILFVELVRTPYPEF